MSEHTKTTQGLWWTPEGFAKGVCRYTESVLALEKNSQVSDNTHFIPAPVDLHAHGGGGHDCMDGDDAIRGMLRSHARFGTGAMLATSVTAPFTDTSAFIASAARVMQSPEDNAAKLLGVHLEGPFISDEKLGAQPPFATALNTEQLESWFSSDIVKVITFAPEADPNGDLIALCSKYNVRAQIGHTNCTWSQAYQALQAGCGITHLYNAMSSFSHRDGGAATAALAYADYAEIILDGFHVDRAAFDAARRAIPHLYSVTDATAASGMPDGEYSLGSYKVHKQNNQVLLNDGTLAGSCLTQRDVIVQLRQWEIDWHTIGLMISAIPARWIGETSVGSISAGASADWLEIQNDKLVARWLSGKRYVFNTGAN